MVASLRTPATALFSIPGIPNAAHGKPVKAIAENGKKKYKNKGGDEKAGKKKGKENKNQKVNDEEAMQRSVNNIYI